MGCVALEAIRKAEETNDFMRIMTSLLLDKERQMGDANDLRSL